MAQLQINSINPDDRIGGDRARDPGFFTFFPTDKEVEKEKNNNEEEMTQEVDQEIDGSSPCVDDMSPVKAAQLEMR